MGELPVVFLFKGASSLVTIRVEKGLNCLCYETMFSLHTSTHVKMRT